MTADIHTSLPPHYTQLMHASLQCLASIVHENRVSANIVTDGMYMFVYTRVYMHKCVCMFAHVKMCVCICRDSADMQYMLIQTNFLKSPK